MTLWGRYQDVILEFPQHVIIQRSEDFSRRSLEGMSLGVIYRAIWGRPYDAFQECLREVLRK